jgi:hypothetical protein
MNQKLYFRFAIALMMVSIALTVQAQKTGDFVKIFDGNNFELIDSFFIVDPSDIAGVFTS